MTYDQLEMLEAIVKNGSYKAASEVLHKTQPSLSIGIKKLEEEFDILLFDRNQYRPKLTDQGQVFYKWAQESLESFRTLTVIGKEMGQHKIEPKITVVLDALIRYEDIHGIIQMCVGPKTATELSLRTEILDRGMELVLNGEADFAIGTSSKPHPDLERIHFKRIEMIPVAKKSIVQEFKNFPQVIVTSNFTSDGTVTKGLKCYVSEHSLKCKMIVGGYGWGRLSKEELENDFKAKSLIQIKEPEINSFTLDIYIMRHKQRVRGPLSKMIWQELKERTSK